MFSALSQGSFVHIFDKTNKPKYTLGEIVGVSNSKYGTNGYNNNQLVVDLKVKIDNNIETFHNINANASIVTYNNGKLVISETKEGAYNEIESFYKYCTDIVNNIPYYESSAKDCENLMKQLNTEYAKDKERDEEINNLKQQVSNIDNKLDKVLEHIAKANKTE